MEMLKTLAVILVVAPMILTTGAVAQTPTEDRQAPDKQTDERGVEGQVQSIDVSGTAITLTDGTKLMTPAGATPRPRAPMEGMMVVPSHREEHGDKSLTGLAAKGRGTAPATSRDSPRTDSP